MHVAVVKVDRETGGMEVERYLIAYDVGRAVNPMLVEGQMAGGFAQGLGGALLEEFEYDERGQPLSVTFADYLLPTVHETPMVEVIVSEDAPSPLNPLGLKGAGEGGATAVGAALAAAIDDAISVPGCDHAPSRHAAATQGNPRPAVQMIQRILSARKRQFSHRGHREHREIQGP